MGTRLSTIREQKEPELLENIASSDFYYSPNKIEARENWRIYELLWIKKVQKLVKLILNKVETRQKKEMGVIIDGLINSDQHSSLKEIKEEIFGAYRTKYMTTKPASKNTLKMWEKLTRYNEKLSIGLTSFFLILSIPDLARWDFALFYATIAFATIANYGTMLQRYTRTRIYNVLEKRHWVILDPNTSCKIYEKQQLKIIEKVVADMKEVSDICAKIKETVQNYGQTMLKLEEDSKSIKEHSEQTLITINEIVNNSGKVAQRIAEIAKQSGLQSEMTSEVLEKKPLQ